jgi:murein DD-endopeptidase MepM/ murein hydrolase activator NlpD
MSFEKAAILAQRLAALMPVRRTAFAALLLAVPTLGVVTAFGIAPGTVTEALPRSSVVIEVPVPELGEAGEPPAQRFVNQERVLRGDTVAALLSRLGVRDEAGLAFLRADPVGRQIFRQLIPGRTLQAETNEAAELLALRYMPNASTVIEVSRGPAGLEARERALAPDTRVLYKTATIRSSLFAATDAAGIPDAVAMQIARVFATDIDFHLDLRTGDTFSVIYEMLYENGELIAPGRILSAEFVNQGRAYHAVLFQDEEGQDAYYALDGNNRAKAFLRSPVEFSRVSSGFGARLHPIHNTWRAHTGTDFAAPSGTRVLSAADGVVTFAGWRNGYGNTIEVRHGGAISTLYAHLSGFAGGVRTGTRVRQGEAIGFVGATGWATGPHLHYEFKVAGVHQNPMKVALPKATPVPAHLRARFDEAAAAASSRIQLVRSSSSSLRFE